MSHRLFVFQSLSLRGVDIGCIRFGYRTQRSLAATNSGDEKLFATPNSDGMAANEKDPDNVYLEGMLTRPDLSVILPASLGIAGTANPN